MKIEYKGKILDTKHYKEMDIELFEKLKKEYYKKPTIKEVRKEVMNICQRGNITIKNITDYYFKDLISKVKMYHSNWTIEDVFTYKPILEHFYGKINANEKVYPKDNNLLHNIKTAFRLGGKGVAAKPSNFKIESVISILKKYNINDNYFDSSCGWGVRMMGSLACGFNYYGTDPNTELTKRLKELSSLFFEIDLFSPSIDIKTQGSEIFIPEWENKMGVAFTSPPYFFLEDYGIGEQSTKNYPNYQDWLQGFYKKTFENTYKYLVDNGHMLINIKNYKNFDLEEQTIKLAKEVGFKYVGNEEFTNISRINEKGELNENDENIFVFKKIIGYEQLKTRKDFNVTSEYIKYLYDKKQTVNEIINTIMYEYKINEMKAKVMISYALDMDL